MDDAFFFAVVRFAVVFLVVFLVAFFVVAIFKKENNIVFDYGMTKNIGNENKRNMSHPSQKIISNLRFKSLKIQIISGFNFSSTN